MYRIRLHGRGGQGMKTAGRILGSAFFAEGFEVQDAPRYGAERRGAPIFATVRADHAPIHERGPILRPDLVVVADETLVPVASAGVMTGLAEHSVLLVASEEPAQLWRERLGLHGPVLTLPVPLREREELRFLGAACAAAAARLVGVIPWQSFETALRQELAELGEAVLAENRTRARQIWQRFGARAGTVREGSEPDLAVSPGPDWVELPFEPARVSVPDVFATATSVQVRTGLWRTLRPVLDRERCHRCHWVCTTFCPDAAISPGEEGYPEIDYDHCKGCLVCVAVCAPHALRAVPEREAAGEGAS